MSNLQEAFQRLRAFSRTSAGPLGEGLDAENLLRELVTKLAALEQSALSGRGSSASTIETALRVWQSSHDVNALSAREIRALCAEPNEAMAPAFVEGLARHPDLPSRRRWLEGLLQSYFAEWRLMKAPERIEWLLRARIKQFKGRSALLEACAPYIDELASDRAAAWLARRTLAGRELITAELQIWGIPSSSKLGYAAANETVTQWTKTFESKKQRLVGPIALGAVKQLTGELLDPTVQVDPAIVGTAVSAMISWQVAEEDERIRNHIVEFLLTDSRFGDPRLPQRGHHWDLCTVPARQEVIAWLAKHDLLFFFNLVIRDRDDGYARREFWLKYVTQVADSHVALSHEDDLRVRSQVNEKLTFSWVSGGLNTSAFLMRFRGTRDLLVVEFSRVGNAMYIYETKEFIARHGSIRKPWFSVEADLKVQAQAVLRVRHTTHWQNEVRTFLSRYGIRPA